MKIFGSVRVEVYIKRFIDFLPDIQGKVFVDIPAGPGGTAKLLHERGAIVQPYDLFPEFFTFDRL